MPYWPRNNFPEHPASPAEHTPLDSLLFLATSFSIDVERLPQDAKSSDIEQVCLRHLEALRYELEAHRASHLRTYSTGVPLVRSFEVPVFLDHSPTEIGMRSGVTVVHPSGQRYS